MGWGEGMCGHVGRLGKVEKACRPDYPGQVGWDCWGITGINKTLDPLISSDADVEL